MSRYECRGGGNCFYTTSINALQKKVAELEAKLHWYQTAFNPPLVKPPKNLVKEAEQ